MRSAHEEACAPPCSWAKAWSLPSRAHHFLRAAEKKFRYGKSQGEVARKEWDAQESSCSSIWPGLFSQEELTGVSAERLQSRRLSRCCTPRVQVRARRARARAARTREYADSLTHSLTHSTLTVTDSPCEAADARSRRTALSHLAPVTAATQLLGLAALFWYVWYLMTVTRSVTRTATASAALRVLLECMAEQRRHPGTGPLRDASDDADHAARRGPARRFPEIPLAKSAWLSDKC